MVNLIGIGPGDPELVTIKAARLLAEADIIYVPQSNGEGRSVAERIVAPYAEPGKIRYVEILMRPGKTGTAPVYAELAAEIARNAKLGSRIVYVTLGDTLLYSTAQYLGRELAALGVEHAYVPGVPAFAAAANLTGIPLVSGKEGMAVCVMPESVAELADLAERNDTLVLMKINKRMPILLDYVRQHPPAEAMLIYRVGLDGEAAYDLTRAETMPEAVGYLSIAIIKRG